MNTAETQQTFTREEVMEILDRVHDDVIDACDTADECRQEIFIFISAFEKGHE